MQRNHRRAEAGFGHHFRFRIILFDPGVVRIDLRLRFRDRRARFQSRDHVRDAAARVARLRSTLFPTGFYRKKNARLGREKTKSRRQDANDLSWDTVYSGITTQNVWIRIETLAPERVRQDNDVLVWVRFFIGEVAADREAYPKRREKFRRDADDFLLLHGARLTDGFGSLHIHGKPRERRNVAAAFVVIGNRRAVVFHAGFWIGVVDRDQPIGLRKWKRPQQNRIDHRENREVRSETNRDRGERGDRERRSFAKLAQSELQIVHVTRSATRPSDRPPSHGARERRWRSMPRRSKQW